MINSDMNPLLKDLQEKYLPLHELNIDQNIEGTHYGFSDIVRECKQAYAAEIAKRRAVEYRDRMQMRQ